MTRFITFFTIPIIMLNTVDIQARVKKMTTVTSDIIIHASPEEVWRVLYDNFYQICDYASAIHSSQMVGGDDVIGIGTERKCHFDAGEKGFVHEKIIALERGKLLEIELIESSLPIKVFGKSEIIPMDYRTKVIQTIRYRTRPGILGKLMKNKFDRDFGKVLIGLKYYIETGEKVNKENFARIYKAYKKLPEGASFGSV